MYTSAGAGRASRQTARVIHHGDPCRSFVRGAHISKQHNPGTQRPQLGTGELPTGTCGRCVPGLAGAAPARQASSGTDCGGLNVDRFGPSAHRQAQQTGPPRHTGAGQPVTASRRLRPPVSGRCPVATFGAAPLRHRPSASGSAPGLAPGSSVSPRSQDGVPPLPGQGEAPRLAQRTRNPPRSITRPGRAFSLNET